MNANPHRLVGANIARGAQKRYAESLMRDQGLGACQMTHRTEAMLPLTRDHHHALRQARQLRKGAESTDRAARLASADDYLNFYLGRALTHFREEEELFFPPAAALEEIRPLVSRAVMEHLSIHRLTGHLKRQLGKGQVAQELLAEISELLRLHV
jgi:hypothetical protein